MASISRNDNAFSKVKGKSNISKLLSHVLKDSKQNISQAQEKLADMMEEVADIEGGVFDNEDMTVSFGSTEEMVIVYGSLDKNDSFVFQALLRSVRPTVFTAGNPASTILEAISNLVKA